jgi:4-hydroxy-2-oxoheptanedioate aldolase
MNGAELKRRLREGATICGTMVTGIRDPRVAQVYGQLGFDYAVLDAEHTPNDRAMLSDAASAFLSAGVCPVVRVPTTAPAEVIMALDGGAHGVLVPYCETPEEVRAVVGAARLRPLKGAYLDRALVGEMTLNDQTRSYLAKRNANNVLFIGIESVLAVENLEKIMDAGEAAGGIDALMIGPNDLSISLGIPEEYENPRYVEAVEHIIKVSEARGVAAGPQSMTPAAAQGWQKVGSRFMLLSSDWRALAEGFRPLLASVRGEAGAGAGAPIKKPV